jgi:phosphatidylglycerophosphate synthase
MRYPAWPLAAGAQAAHMQGMPEHRRVAARWIGWSPVRVWGLVPVERLRRSLARAGLWDAGPWTGQPPPEAGAVLLLLGDHVYNDALIVALVRNPGILLVRGDGRPAAAHVTRDRAPQLARVLGGAEAPPADLPQWRGRDLVPARELHRHIRPSPQVMPVSAELRGAVENRLFELASRRDTDAVERLLWPRPARALARAAARIGLFPTHLTAVNLMLTVLAALAFHGGWLAFGLLAAWALSLVDAVDGKLARVTLCFSQLGGGLGHFVNQLAPPLWWWAWWAGGGGDAPAMAVLVAGSAVLPVLEAVFETRFGFALPLWRRLDGLFRLVAARRNMVLLILTMGWSLGHAHTGYGIAAAWMLVSLAVYAVRLAQAWRTPPVSWLEQ